MCKPRKRAVKFSDSPVDGPVVFNAMDIVASSAGQSRQMGGAEEYIKFSVARVGFPGRTFFLLKPGGAAGGAESLQAAGTGFSKEGGLMGWDTSYFAAIRTYIPSWESPAR